MKVSSQVATTLLVAAVSVGAASAFAPPPSAILVPQQSTTTMASKSSTHLAMSKEEEIIMGSATPAAAAAVMTSSTTTTSTTSSTANSKEVAFGWIPDASKPCYGLPGAIEPLGFFDPLDLSKDADLNTVKLYREAEIMHGRVAMLATVGYLIGETTPTILYHGGILSTMANNQLAETPTSLLLPLFVVINFAEAWRSVNGWVEPNQALWTLRDKYYPGGIGFDFLGWAPRTTNNINNSEAFARMATRELSNGRLAMIAVAGMCVQELVTDRPLFGY